MLQVKWGLWVHPMRKLANTVDLRTPPAPTPAAWRRGCCAAPPHFLAGNAATAPHYLEGLRDDADGAGGQAAATLTTRKGYVVLGSFQYKQ